MVTMDRISAAEIPGYSAATRRFLELTAGRKSTGIKNEQRRPSSITATRSESTETGCFTENAIMCFIAYCLL
jgi:hypothetical protein